jgi:hypothetical protein
MTTDDGKKRLRVSHSTLPEMRARLALLNAAISALQRYQGRSKEDLRGVRLRPFLVARRDNPRAEKAS